MTNRHSQVYILIWLKKDKNKYLIKLGENSAARPASAATSAPSSPTVVTAVVPSSAAVEHLKQFLIIGASRRREIPALQSSKQGYTQSF